MQNSQKDLYKKLLGKVGESNAVKFLKKKGYKILEKNYKTYVGEIDIICKDNTTIVFVEVKTRSSEDFGAPSEAVNRAKILKYKKVATEYLVKTNNTESCCRFDVIEVENDKINHILDAFMV